MDFRMEKSSWALLVFMFATMLYFLVDGAGGSLTAGGYFQAVLFALLAVLVLVALCSIPVLVYCYVVKKIPDIDYSIVAAAALTLVGIVSEFI